MIQILVNRDPKLSKVLDKIDASIKYVNGKDPIMYRQIGAVADVSTLKNFEAGGRPQWEPRKYAYPWPILKKTMLMMRKTLSYIRANWITQGESHFLNIKSAFYGIFHQQGTKRLPVRKFVALNPDDRNVITRVIQKHLELK